MIPFPLLTPWLSSLWLRFVTPLYARIGRKLIESTFIRLWSATIPLRTSSPSSQWDWNSQSRRRSSTKTTSSPKRKGRMLYPLSVARQIRVAIV